MRFVFAAILCCFGLIASASSATKYDQKDIGLYTVGLGTIAQVKFCEQQFNRQGELRYSGKVIVNSCIAKEVNRDCLRTFDIPTIMRPLPHEGNFCEVLKAFSESKELLQIWVVYEPIGGETFRGFVETNADGNVQQLSQWLLYVYP